MERIGFDITHVYGLTETYGPASVCAKHEEWGSLPLTERARLNARQGVAGLAQEAMAVLDPDTMKPRVNNAASVVVVARDAKLRFAGSIVAIGTPPRRTVNLPASSR